MTTALLTRGSAFGDIKLTHTLGSGGFSDVYLGTDTRGRKLAVKVLRLSKELLEGQNERVNRERDVLGSIDSRGVAKLIKSDLTGEHPWIASEFIEGLTLRESIARDGEMSLDETLGLVRRIAEILDELHSAGIAHRDLTPNNIIVGGDGPVIIDFGSARVDLENTSTGSVLLAGTQAYAAPETIRGEPTGRSGDIFALARIAQFCISGSDEGVPQLPSSIQAGLRDDPEQRPSAKEISQALTDFAGPTDRFRVSEKTKLPRRVRIRTLVAASLLATAVTAGATAWWLTREAPVYSLTEEEISEFEERTFLDAERSHLGNPYFADPVIPAETALRHESPNQIFSSAPHLSSQTLAAFSIIEENFQLLAEYRSADVVVTASPAPRWLKEQGLLYPRVPIFELNESGWFGDLYVEGERRIEDGSCELDSPTHGAYVASFDLFVVGSSVECGPLVSEPNKFYFVAYQPSSETLFRLSGRAAEIDRSEVIVLLQSAINRPEDATNSVVDLPQDEFVPDFLQSVGYSENLLAQESDVLPYAGRIAIRFPAGSSVGITSIVEGFDLWALTDDPSMFLGWSATIPIGSYFVAESESAPVVDNTLGIDLILMVDVDWGEPGMPAMGALRFADIDSSELPTHLTDLLFEKASRTSRYFGGSELTDAFVKSTLEVLLPGVEENNATSRLAVGLEWNVLLPSRFGGDASAVMEVVRFGDIDISMPPHLDVTTESLGDLTYSARANPSGHRTETLRPETGSHLLLRNSSVILPGATGPVRSELSAISNCRIFEEAEILFGPLIGILSIESNCVERAVVRPISADDQIERFPTKISLNLTSPRDGMFPWTAEKEALEVFAAEMYANYSEDIVYMSYLISSLQESLDGMTVEEARAAFGGPIHDVGIVDSFDLLDVE